MIAGWVYLRFYQRQKDGSRGDMAESFSFASFFPEAVKPFVAVMANTGRFHKSSSSSSSNEYIPLIRVLSYLAGKSAVTETRKIGVQFGTNKINN